jgi:two-component system, OmpR family, alkaline phosphatase synthesis response regulator PhoP
MKRVLLVEDDDGIAELVESSLGRDGLRVERFRDAESALSALQRLEPDAILLDLGLPGLDGLDFCRIVRRTRRTPILILTSRREEMDKVLGLELGADDYVTKPFGVRELLARIKALLRRAEPPADEIRRFGSLAIDTAAKLVTKDGSTVELTAMEYRILEVLSASPDRVFSRDEILDRLGEAAHAGYERTIDSHLARVRRKVEDDPREPRFLETVRGLGYRFVRSRE